MKRAAPALAVMALGLTALVSLTPAPGAAESPLRFVTADGSPVPVGPMAGRPAVGDCDGDGNPDVVVACGT